MGKLRTILHMLSLGIVDSNEEVERKNTPCRFDEKLTQDDFERIAISVANPIKRLKVKVENEFVIGNVTTKSGINTWNFKLDYNNFGKVTGRYWIRSVDNSDSQIPQSYAKQLETAIKEHLSGTH